MTTYWQGFEDFVFERIQKDFPDYEVEYHPILENGLRPDYILNSAESIVVADAKEKNRLQASDVKQIAEYIYELDADFGVIYVSSYTKISKRLLVLARSKKIKIIQTIWSIMTYYGRTNC